MHVAAAYIYSMSDSELNYLIYLVKASCFHYNQVNVTVENGLYDDRQ